ncbi:MAG: hypoxanthine-guanine phosphoribosyltransferase [Pseudomonadales bacterium]|nr:hypoxanthine-guanine phosphoribosyltransferase [Pseudomonadales bacterium]
MTTEVPRSETLYDNARISTAIDLLAGQVRERCGSNEWIVLCVMNGGLIFCSELMLRLDLPLKLDFVRVSRYRETTTGGDLNWHARPESDLRGRRILLVDDIFDEGTTLAAVANWCGEQGADEVVTVVLVEKLHDRKVTDFRPDLIGLTCPDAYVFGFGMDYQGLWRNLPEIRQLND